MRGTGQQLCHSSPSSLGTIVSLARKEFPSRAVNPTWACVALALFSLSLPGQFMG